MKPLQLSVSSQRLYVPYFSLPKRIYSRGSLISTTKKTSKTTALGVHCELTSFSFYSSLNSYDHRNRIYILSVKLMPSKVELDFI